MIPLPTLPKPRFGEPCNGCGVCCTAEVCKVGRVLHGESVAAPCPQLKYDGKRFWCGAVAIADEISPAHGMMLRWRMGVGLGCDSSDEE